jgi:hypothetical protein
MKMSWALTEEKLDDDPDVKVAKAFCRRTDLGVRAINISHIFYK